MDLRQQEVQAPEHLKNICWSEYHPQPGAVSGFLILDKGDGGGEHRAREAACSCHWEEDSREGQRQEVTRRPAHRPGR